MILSGITTSDIATAHIADVGIATIQIATTRIATAQITTACWCCLDCFYLVDTPPVGMDQIENTPRIAGTSVISTS